MKIRTIEWKANAIKIIDQTKLPLKLEYIYIRDLKRLWQAVRRLEVRGAPALAAAAALGVYLGIKEAADKDFISFSRRMDKVIRYLGSSRPTARNLFWALERMAEVAVANRKKSIAEIKKLLFQEAREMIEEDRHSCRRIAAYGQEVIRDGDSVLTVCNAGILATIDYGTALGIIYKAKEAGKKIKVYACETRPLLQGARLTTWELQKKNIDVTLICDNMAATLMRQGKINKVITGADRIAANGDIANKIGTYNLAVLSRYHKIPFYVAAPASSFDLEMKSGRQIPIEQRPGREITDLFFKRKMAPKNTQTFNPAFDVTDHRLITAIVTDRGVIKPPYSRNIGKRIK